jgi:hypothetical protein
MRWFVHPDFQESWRGFVGMENNAPAIQVLSEKDHDGE